MALLLAAGLAAASAKQGPESPAGRWDAVVVLVNDAEVPFRFEVSGRGADLKGSFFDGSTRIVSQRGSFKDGVLTLPFEQYAATLEATLKDGKLEGRYLRAGQRTMVFRASRYVPPPRPTGDVPAIGGVWKVTGIDASKNKGEQAWRLIVRQSGPEVSAAVLRVDGDTGTLTGSFGAGKFVLSHFSGARPSLFEVTPGQEAGTLEILQNRTTKLTAIRIADPRAKEEPDPIDPLRHTRMKDPAERLHFSFADLNGKTVSDTDPKLQGKVLLVSITGSWCPNCRDEAPFLANLYKRYRKQGLEIVALSFEEADQLANPTRLRGFIKEYGIEYTVLLAGDPDQLTAKVPQADNLNSFPTSFLIGRDGKVRTVHAGFPSPASGAFYTEAQRDLTAQVERLLAERPTGTQ